jgi:catechol 2,3-dioxygenase-like lactoylglutathione lyase family enzyme
MPAAISCVTFPVDDLAKSLAFYRDGLGLTVEESDEEHAAFDLDGVYSGYFTDPDGHVWEVLFDGED